ncbi:hypothetical protein G163CM_28700 [Pseudocitrobacter corydidari]|uniref:Uncharacterized protein n=1 Tax=Pseudocitrobacter corydidari TaxID=2891570 RepID=A0ABY3S946_9ENTR|nr:hypothetical protein G163CM_28700 [Pseudocitrobacter corydidari]
MVSDLNVEGCDLNRGCYNEKRLRRQECSEGEKKRFLYRNRLIRREKCAYLMICACISCTEITFSFASAFSAMDVAKPPFRVVS